MKIPQLNRQIWLIDIIFRNEGISRSEIEKKWLDSQVNEWGNNYDRTTFNNDRKHIFDIFDIEIVCKNQKYFIENKEILEKNSIQNWIFNSFSVGNLLEEFKSLYKRILLEEIPSRVGLRPILEAMKENRQISFSYQRHQNEIVTSRQLSPFCVKIFNNRWYVIGQEKGKSEERIFALDRMTNLQKMAEKYSYPDDFDGEDYFLYSFGIFADRTILPQKIVIKANAEKTNYLKSLRLHHSQKLVKTEGDFSFFEYHLRPTFDFRQEILSHGDEMEVVSPESFRQEIKEMIEKMQQLYK